MSEVLAERRRSVRDLAAPPARASAFLFVLAVSLFAPLVPVARADDPAPPADAPARTHVTRDAETGLLDLDLDAPTQAALRAVGAAGGVELMLDAAIEGRVALRANGLEPRAAVREVARAAGLIVEETPSGIVFVRRPRPADRLAIEVVGDGHFRVPDRFAYDIVVIADPPQNDEARAAREALSRLERMKQVSLTVAPDVSERIAAELAKHWDAYEKVLERAGERVTLPRTVPAARARVYVELEHTAAYLVEVLVETGGAELWHLVFAVEASGQQRIRRLVVFATPLGGGR